MKEFLKDTEIANIMSLKYGKKEGYVLDKNVRTALQMAKFLKWDNKWIILNKELGKFVKVEGDKYPSIVWKKQILENKTFISIMDKKFKEVVPKKVESNEVKFITPTKIGEFFGKDAKEVNKILISLKLQTYTETGYMLLKKDGQTCLKNMLGFVNTAYEKSSIRWNENILKNPLVIRAMKDDSISSKSSAPKSSAPKSSAPKSSVYIEIDREKWSNDWYIELGRLQAVGTDDEIQKHLKRKPVQYRTERGDMVPSKNEVILANALWKAGTPYITGEVVKGIPEVIVSDFYIPYRYLKDGKVEKLDIWAEYWGDMGPDYERNKKRKRDLSKKYGFILLEFPASTSEDMTTRLERIIDNHPEIKKRGMTFRELNKAHWEFSQMIY